MSTEREISVEVDHSLTGVPESVQRLQATWEKWLKSLRDHQNISDCCDEAFKAITDASWSTPFNHIQSPKEIWEQTATALIHAVCRIAEDILTVNGVKLDISGEKESAEIYGKISEDNDYHFDKLNLIELFNSLLVRFGGDKGVQKTYQEEAHFIIDSLIRLKTNESWMHCVFHKTKRHRRCDIWVQLEDSYTHKGRYRISWRNRSDIQRLFVRSFHAMEEAEGITEGIYQYSRAIVSYFDLEGQADGLLLGATWMSPDEKFQVTLRKAKIQIKVPHNYAEAMHRFVNNYKK